METVAVRVIPVVKSPLDSFRGRHSISAYIQVSRPPVQRPMASLSK
jgi:hypothetical protein